MPGTASRTSCLAQPLLRIAGFGYNDAATEDAYSRVFAFFNEHLAASI